MGDSVPHDVAGARALGLKTLLITELEPDPAQAALYDHVIGDLRELLRILDP